jgi:serpin B
MKRIAVVLVLGCLAVAPVLAPARGHEKQAEEDARAVVRGNTAFALSLYARLRGEPGNLFFSPYSISTALAMTYAGARGETADEMARTLAFPLGSERLHPAFAALRAEVARGGNKRGCQLSVANALWGQKGLGFRPEFLATTGTHYGAGLHEVDFAGAPEPARRTINAWVADRTRHKIPDLLQPGDVDADTRLVLTNAIYFKGLWDSPFKKRFTRTGPFRTSAGSSVRCALMCQTGSFPYLDGGDFQALELPYQGEDVALVVVLPRKADGLAGLEKRLSAANLAAWLEQMEWRRVQVTLPRFRMLQTCRLSEILKGLGMSRAFRGGVADFRGLIDREGEELYLDDVIHKAFVEMNEQGTDAAAATAVTSRRNGARRARVFRADHPFLFLIRDRRSGSILFLGRLTDPS